MSRTPFRLGYFTRFGPTGWQAADDRLYGDGWETGEHHIELVQRLEASGGFDFLFFDDTTSVSTNVGGTMDADLRQAIWSPRHEAIPLLPLLAKATSNIGVVCTASTTFYPPYILSRLLTTVDSLSGGRAGWNIVTTAEDSAARNHNMDQLPPHGEKYDIADEFLQVATGLWSSWEPGALVKDVENNTYVDPTKVRHLDHRGKYFQVAGPLNAIPSPQGKPVLMQAGGSPKGRDFAAKYADAIFTPPMGGLEGMKATREDFRARAHKFGRNPDDVKVFYAATIKFVEDGEVKPPTSSQVEYAVIMTSTGFNTDLSQFDLDQPWDPYSVETGGSTALLEPMKAFFDAGVSLRDACCELWLGGDDLGLTGTPDEIGDRMMDAMDYIGGDGFLVIGCDSANGAWNHGVIDHVIPHLQDNGVVRTEYQDRQLLRDMLLDRSWIKTS